MTFSNDIFMRKVVFSTFAMFMVLSKEVRKLAEGLINNVIIMYQYKYVHPTL